MGEHVVSDPSVTLFGNNKLIDSMEEEEVPDVTTEMPNKNNHIDQKDSEEFDLKPKSTDNNK